MQGHQASHDLVDELSESGGKTLSGVQQQEGDSLRSFLDAVPDDDEPVSDEDRAAIRQGHEDRAKGEVVSQQEVRRLRETG